VTLLDFEKTWKFYTKTIGDLLGEPFDVSFGRCDITKEIILPEETETDFSKFVNIGLFKGIGNTNLFLFSYVTHETSTLAAVDDFIFYRNIVNHAIHGSVCIFADVMIHSVEVYGTVYRVMKEEGLRCNREVSRLVIPSNHDLRSEVMILLIKHVE